MGFFSRLFRRSEQPEVYDFDHQFALKVEKDCARTTIMEHFPRIYRAWEENNAKGIRWGMGSDIWFPDEDSLVKFMDSIKDKKCLEIGSGPFGYLGARIWIKDRYIIDPLIDFYKSTEIEEFGKTFFTDDIKLHNIFAEDLIKELVGQIDGAIICQNALDHCDDPDTVLFNISQYAAKGCIFLLWTDIWHNIPDRGHKNITKEISDMDKKMDGLGFEVISVSSPVRNDNSTIEYGRVAVKR